MDASTFDRIENAARVARSLLEPLGLTAINISALVVTNKDASAIVLVNGGMGAWESLLRAGVTETRCDRQVDEEHERATYIVDGLYEGVGFTCIWYEDLRDPEESEESDEDRELDEGEARAQAREDMDRDDTFVPDCEAAE